MKQSIDKIFLTGFMGSGKSTFAPILANIIGWDSQDLDKEIELSEGKTINSLFKENGEPYFREKESRILKGMCSEKGFVFSLGGGAIVNPDNLQLIKSSGILVYLKVPSEVIYQRLKFKGDRPLLLDENNHPLPTAQVIQKINGLLAAREVYYNQADVIFESGKVSLGKSADILYNKLRKTYFFLNKNWQ